MAILQAFNGFIYEIMTLCSYAYFPEIQETVSEKTYQWYSSLYMIAMFGNEVFFLLIMAVVTIVLKTSGRSIHIQICIYIKHKLTTLSNLIIDVMTAQISQALDTVMSGIYFYFAWYFFTKKEKKSELPKGGSLISTPFTQISKTAIGLYKHYPRSVGLYFVACVFTAAAVDSFTTISVTYMNEVLDFNAMQLNIMFLIVLVFSLPGSWFANWIGTKIGGHTKLCSILDFDRSKQKHSSILFWSMLGILDRMVLSNCKFCLLHDCTTRSGVRTSRILSLLYSYFDGFTSIYLHGHE